MKKVGIFKILFIFLVICGLTGLVNSSAFAQENTNSTQSSLSVEQSENESEKEELSEQESVGSNETTDQEETTSEDLNTDEEFSQKNVKTNIKSKKISAYATHQIDSIADLIASFNSASDGDVLTLTNAFKTDVTTMSATIPLVVSAGDTRNITIDGAGLELIPGSSLTTAFMTLTHNGSGTITLKNMNIKETLNVAIQASGSGNLTLDNMVFDQIGLYALNSSISGTTTIKDSQFLNGKNLAYNDGNGSVAHKINIENSYFYNNTGNSASAVALNNNAVVTINTSTFEANISTGVNYAGGAVSVIDKSNINLLIENSSFYKNASNGNGKVGGGIGLYHVHQSDIKIKNNYFAENTTNGTANTNDGGAIAFKNNAAHYIASLEISGNTFLKNYASDNGGAIIVESAHNNNSYAHIFNNTFVQNRADVLGNAFRLGVGGAIQTYGSPNTVISHNTFYQNHNNSSSGGAAIGVNGSTAAGPSNTKVANNIFINNTSTSATSKSKNVAFTNSAFVNVDNNGNVGYDAGQDFIPGDANRNALVKVENIFTEFYEDGDTMPAYAAVGDAKSINTGQAGSADHKYTKFSYIPSPRIDEMLRTNDPRTVTGILEDVRGYPRERLTAENPYYPNAGAVEIYWTKFDPGLGAGGDWSSRFNVESEGGIESLAYPGVFYKVNNPPTYVSGEPVYEQNNTFTRNTLTGPTNYGFTGWVDNAFNPAEVKDVNESYEARKQTYVAQWTLNVFHLDFDLQGGNAQSGHDNDFDTQIINNGINDNLGSEPNSVPVKEGYTFEGWYTDDSTDGVLWIFNTDQVLADTTLYAKWKEAEPIKKYKVTFNMNGHGKQISSQNVEEGNKASKPKNPTEKGYVFKGWYTEKECINLYNFNSEVNNNITLYAKWEDVSNPAKKYKVTFNMNGHGKQISSQKVEEGNKASKPKNPTEKGYVFKGWYTEKAGVNLYNFNSKVNNNITLYAKWEKDSDGSEDLPITGNDMSGLLLLTSIAMVGSSALIIRRKNDIVSK